MTAPACFVGLDMGTTNTRAWCIYEERIVVTARTGVGIRDAAVAGGGAVLQAAMVSLLSELEERRPSHVPPPVAVVAAGMISSNLGIAEVPHVAAPAGPRELAAAVERCDLPSLEGLPLFLVPGVRTGPLSAERSTIGTADVMRGEETLCVGLHAGGLLPPDSSLLNLGSHWKHVRLDASGRVAGSATALSGELLHAAQTHTILAGSVPDERPGHLEGDWARAGMEEAKRSGLERALFCVRLLEQRTESSPSERLSYLVGAFVGSALPWVLREVAGRQRVVITGGAAVGELFAEVLVQEGREAVPLSEEVVHAAMARGLALIGAARLQPRG